MRFQPSPPHGFVNLNGGIPAIAAMSECRLCALIAEDRLPERLLNLVAETGGAVVVANRRPIAPGHLTIMLKRHHARTSEMSDGDWAGIGRLCGRLSAVLELRYRPRRVVFLSDGKRSAHIHLHLIPESEDAELGLPAAIADLNQSERPATLDEAQVADLVAGLKLALADGDHA